MPGSPFPRVPEIIAEGPLRKSKFYEFAAEHPGLIKKIDGVSVVDRAKYYKILARAPAATLGGPSNSAPAPRKHRVLAAREAIKK
jgi:hypothetical protein